MLFSFEILRVLGCCTTCNWRLYVPNITPLSNVLSSPNSCIPLDFIPNVSKYIFPNIISQIWCYPDPVLYPGSISSDLIYWFSKYLTCSSILDSHPQPWIGRNYSGLLQACSRLAPGLLQPNTGESIVCHVASRYFSQFPSQTYLGWPGSSRDWDDITVS